MAQQDCITFPYYGDFDNDSYANESWVLRFVEVASSQGGFLNICNCTNATLSPTQAPTGTNEETTIVTVVLFCVFFALALVARYTTHFLFRFITGMQRKSNPELIARIQADLEFPVFLAQVAVFIYLAFVPYNPVDIATFQTVCYWLVSLLGSPSHASSLTHA